MLLILLCSGKDKTVEMVKSLVLSTGSIEVKKGQIGEEQEIFRAETNIPYNNDGSMSLHIC